MPTDIRPVVEKTKRDNAFLKFISCVQTDWILSPAAGAASSFGAAPSALWD